MSFISIKNIFIGFAATALITLLISCSGDSDNDNARGQLVDSPVSGVEYSTSPSGIRGVTDSFGYFQYQPGDQVLFTLGNISLGVAATKGILTVADLTNGNETSSINMTRFLLTLDEDQDPDNGIQIPQEVRNEASDFQGDPEDFSMDFENGPLVNFAEMVYLRINGQFRPLVGEARAQSHYNCTQADVVDGQFDGDCGGMEEEEPQTLAYEEDPTLSENGGGDDPFMRQLIYGGGVQGLTGVYACENLITLSATSELKPFYEVSVSQDTGVSAYQQIVVNRVEDLDQCQKLYEEEVQLGEECIRAAYSVISIPEHDKDNEKTPYVRRNNIPGDKWLRHGTPPNPQIRDKYYGCWYDEEGSPCFSPDSYEDYLEYGVAYQVSVNRVYLDDDGNEVTNEAGQTVAECGCLRFTAGEGGTDDTYCGLYGGENGGDGDGDNDASCQPGSPEAEWFAVNAGDITVQRTDGEGPLFGDFSASSAYTAQIGTDCSFSIDGDSSTYSAGPSELNFSEDNPEWVTNDDFNIAVSKSAEQPTWNMLIRELPDNPNSVHLISIE